MKVAASGTLRILGVLNFDHVREFNCWGLRGVTRYTCAVPRQVGSALAGCFSSYLIFGLSLSITLAGPTLTRA